MTHDWPSFTSSRLSAQPAFVADHAPGYLEWTKIDPLCLRRQDLGELLRHGCSDDPEIAENLHTAKARVQRSIRTLKARGITKICTGVSWCDYVCYPGGPAWIDWYLREYAEHFDILPRITYTPPPLTVDNGKTNSPPRDPVLFAAFVQVFLKQYANVVGSHVELWNEWNLNTDWRPELDPEFRTFTLMISLAALVAHGFGKKVVLGGITGISDSDAEPLAIIARQGLFRYIDVAGFHDLRGTWSDDTPSLPLSEMVHLVRNAASTPPESDASLEARIEEAISGAEPELQAVLRTEQQRVRNVAEAPGVWLTEYGFPVVRTKDCTDLEYQGRIQAAIFAYATDCLRTGGIERVYWYMFQDFIGDSVRKYTTGWEDETQHHFGETRLDGSRRLLGSLLDEGGPERVQQYAYEHGMFPLVDAASLGRMKLQMAENS